MHRRSFLRASAASLVMTGLDLSPAGARVRRRRRPNVLLIVADDLGFADLGCYGGEIATPNLDRLAMRGTRFTGFRTAAVCAATRASLLTGLNNHSAGIGLLTDEDRGVPGYRGDLTRANSTTAEALRADGYATFHVGKWHLNHVSTSSAQGPNGNWPLQRGFQQSYWFQGHSSDYFEPSDLYDGNRMIEAPRRDDYYITDDLTEQAIAMIDRHHQSGGGAPWFQYLAYCAPHSPLHVRPEDRDTYRGRYDAGWDVLRDERLARQKQLGLVPADLALPERNAGVSAWASLTAQQQRIYARYMEVYAGVVQRLDWNVGRVLEALERRGEADNTLIFFLSDNGGSAEGAGTGTPNFLAGNSQEIPIQSVEALLARMGERGTFPHYPTGWAMVSNTPFKLYKQMPELGGVADPLIVRWPHGMESPGTIRRGFQHVSDIHPTILAVTGARPGRTARRIEGVSFAPTLRPRADRPRSQYFEIRGRRAMYRDGWRAVSTHQPGTPFESDPWRLYDLRVDFNETRDLATQHPEILASLRSAWEQAAVRYNVLPLDNRSPIEKTRNGRWLTPQQSHWDLLARPERISADVAPATPGRNHRIRLLVDRPDERAQGVLVAYGNRYFGWVLYVQDGRLVYEIANMPFSHRAVGTTRLPTGRCEIVYEQEMQSRPFEGRGRLKINGAVVAEFELPAFAFGVAYQGLEVGRNGAASVTDSYAAPFPFSGRIVEATLDYDVSPYNAEEMQNILRRNRIRL